MCKRVTAHHMRTIYLEQCGITMGFDPIRSTMSMRKDGMTGMTRRRGRPCAWPPARGVCGVPPPLKPPFEIGDPLEVMNSMYTDRNKTEVRRTVAPWCHRQPERRGRRADDLANSSRTETLRTFPASRRPSMSTPRGAASEHASCGCTSGCTNCIRPKERRTSNSTIEYAGFSTIPRTDMWQPNCESTRRGAGRRGRTSVDSTNVLSACITAGTGKHQHANAAQKSCGEEIGSDARWSDGPYQDRDVEPLPLIALRIIAE